MGMYIIQTKPGWLCWPKIAPLPSEQRAPLASSPGLPRRFVATLDIKAGPKLQRKAVGTPGDGAKAAYGLSSSKVHTTPLWQLTTCAGIHTHVQLVRCHSGVVWCGVTQRSRLCIFYLCALLLAGWSQLATFAESLFFFHTKPFSFCNAFWAHVRMSNSRLIWGSLHWAIYTVHVVLLIPCVSNSGALKYLFKATSWGSWLEFNSALMYNYSLTHAHTQAHARTHARTHAHTNTHTHTNLSCPTSNTCLSSSDRNVTKQNSFRIILIFTGLSCRLVRRLRSCCPHTSKKSDRIKVNYHIAPSNHPWALVHVYVTHRPKIRGGHRDEPTQASHQTIVSSMVSAYSG